MRKVNNATNSSMNLLLIILQAAFTHISFFFFFNDPATTEFSPLPLHDALPISSSPWSIPVGVEPFQPRRRPTASATPASEASARSCAAAAGSVEARSNARTMYGVSTSASRRSEEHTSELQSQSNLVCRLLLEKK